MCFPLAYAHEKRGKNHEHYETQVENWSTRAANVYEFSVLSRVGVCGFVVSRATLESFANGKVYANVKVFPAPNASCSKKLTLKKRGKKCAKLEENPLFPN